MQTSILLRYMSQDESTQLHEEIITTLPNIGASITYNKLKSSYCTGFFVIISVECIKEDDYMNYEVVALETNEDVYIRGLDKLVSILTR